MPDGPYQPSISSGRTTYRALHGGCNAGEQAERSAGNGETGHPSVRTLVTTSNDVPMLGSIEGWNLTPRSSPWQPRT